MIKESRALSQTIALGCSITQARIHYVAAAPGLYPSSRGLSHMYTLTFSAANNCRHLRAEPIARARASYTGDRDITAGRRRGRARITHTKRSEMQMQFASSFARAPSTRNSLSRRAGAAHCARRPFDFQISRAARAREKCRVI